MKSIVATGIIAMLSIAQPSFGQEVRLHAAGSLTAAMTEIADAFEADTGTTVQRNFGPSGLLRERIEGGEPAEVFASANMRHPEALADAGLAGPVTAFARNSLCALAQRDVTITTETLLDVMLSKEIRLGMSTPKADPSGDYAWELFAKADELREGATEALRAKALQLTGGPDSATPPEGRNPYAWVLTEDRADVFITYCTNAVLARKDTPELRRAEVPKALNVGATYGLTVLSGASQGADALASFITGAKGQNILTSYGFSAAK